MPRGSTSTTSPTTGRVQPRPPPPLPVRCQPGPSVQQPHALQTTPPTLHVARRDARLLVGEVRLLVRPPAAVRLACCRRLARYDPAPAAGEPHRRLRCRRCAGRTPAQDRDLQASARTASPKSHRRGQVVPRAALRPRPSSARRKVKIPGPSTPRRLSPAPQLSVHARARLRSAWGAQARVAACAQSARGARLNKALSFSRQQARAVPGELTRVPPAQVSTCSASRRLLT